MAIEHPNGMWRGIWKWLAPLPVIFLLIYACSQTAHLGMSYPVPSVVSSNLKATYAPWERVVVAPISTAIIRDIPELQDNTFDELTRPGDVWIEPPGSPVVAGIPNPVTTATGMPGSPLQYPATSTAVALLPASPTPTPVATLPLGSVTATNTPTVTATATPLWMLTSTPTATSILTAAPSYTPTRTTGITLTATGTPTPSKTPTTQPSYTPTPTLDEPSPFTATATPSPTLTRIPTITLTPTITRTPTPTQPPCGGNIPQGEPNIGPPDGSFASLPCGGVLILDLPALGYSPIDLSSPDADYDLVFYERIVPGQNRDYIEMDWVSVEVGPGPSGSCATSTWYTGLNWGDYIVYNNGHLGNSYPEIDNQIIPITALYGSLPYKTGIAIDLDYSSLGIPAGLYPCIRIISPFNDPGNDSAEVDALQILN